MSRHNLLFLRTFMTLVLERGQYMGIIESAQARDFGCKSLASSSKHHYCRSVLDVSLGNNKKESVKEMI